MTQDLLLRYRPVEVEVLSVLHLLFAAMFGIAGWRLMMRLGGSDQARVVSSLIALVLVGGAWLGGWAAIVWLGEVHSSPPWWSPWREGR